LNLAIKPIVDADMHKKNRKRRQYKAWYGDKEGKCTGHSDLETGFLVLSGMSFWPHSDNLAHSPNSKSKTHQCRDKDPSPVMTC
jgi:hypothetical protein